MCILYLLLSVCVWYADGFGLQRRSGLGIHGGDRLNITEAPFFAIFRPKNQLFGCGASIVTNQFLVTAAHCVILGKYMIARKSYYRVIVGTDNIYGGKEYEIASIFIHPKYSIDYYDFDIAVVKLKKKLTFSNTVQPIKLAGRNLVIQPGEVVDTMGFGHTEKGSTSQVLLKVELPYVDNSTCSKNYMHLRNENIITERMLCAGGEEGKDSCQNDSGGPLRYKNQLAGVVSWGKSCGQKGYPGVYARISALRDYIDDIIKNNS